MRRRFALGSSILLAASAALAAGGLAPAPARADAPCATVAAETPGSPQTVPAAGSPCWTDVTPYPFGADGNPVDPPVDPTSPCLSAVESDLGHSAHGDNLACYLRVTSMAFRAWNRGLAATSVATESPTSTPFGLWRFDGTRWSPDPTFPGQGTCKGDTVLWAGKLDYWLVGKAPGVSDGWPALCRFDGVEFAWEPLAVPPAALDRVPRAVGSLAPQPGGIQTGTCFAWNDCTFFGSFGVVLHWDGSNLADASPDLDGKPWLATDYVAATTGGDTAGAAVGIAVGAASPPAADANGQVVPAGPPGSPPPQVYASTGAGFAPLDFFPPAGTDFAAVALGTSGSGWSVTNPAGPRGTSVKALFPIFRSSPTTRRPGRVPPLPISSTGASPGCSGPVADPDHKYLWLSVATLPGSGDALAGGWIDPSTALAPAGFGEPVIVRPTCHGTSTRTRFRVRDPNGTTLVQADAGGAITSVAASAANDAWAASTRGVLPPVTQSSLVGPNERPHVYRLTDGLAPAAAPGDDIEPRPIVVAPDPPIFIQETPPPEPPVTPAPVAAPPPAPRRPAKRPKLRAAVYAVTNTKPKLLGRDRVLVSVLFSVRRPVTIGLQALRRGTVVSTSGLKHFKGGRGKLSLTLDRRRYPTRFRFVTPAGAAGTVSAPPGPGLPS